MIGNKISIYTTSAFPYGMAAESFMRSMAVGLQKNGQHVIVNKIRGDRFGDQNNDTGIKDRFIFFRKRPKLEIIKMVEIILLIIILPLAILRSKYSDNSNIIILYGIEYSYLVIPILIMSRILNQKVFRIITDDYHISTIKPVWWKAPKLFSYIHQYSNIDKYLNGIICLSHYLVKRSKANGVKKSKVILIPHFINPESFEDRDNKNGSGFSDVMRIGYAGAIIQANGIIDLFKAYEILSDKYPNIELLVSGNLKKRSSEILNAISELKKKYGRKVIFPGMVDSKKVPQLLHSCDILVNPRKSSTFAEASFPTKIGEYFACKRPVVATKVGDLAIYFKEQKELILVSPDSPDSLAKGIIQLIESQKKRKEMPRIAYSWMKNNLDYLKSAKRLVEFIIKEE